MSDFTNKLTDELTDVGRRFIMNKNELDSYKKLVDADNKIIKEIMADINVDEFAIDSSILKRSVEHRETMNEDALLQYLKDNNIEGVIKTKEYVDMDALESAIYNESISAEIVSGMSKCKTTTEVVKLTVKKAKKDGD